MVKINKSGSNGDKLQLDEIKEEKEIDGVTTLKLDAGKEEKMKLKNMRKNDLKRLGVVLLVIMVVIVAFVAWLIGSGKNDGPVYGDRCASLVSLDTAIFDSVETAMEEDVSINDVAISVDCRIIKINIDFVEGTVKDTATSLAKQTLVMIDDAAGYEAADGSSWSVLLGEYDGRGQYNVDFMLTTTNSEDFPIFGTKMPKLDAISWTYASVKDQTTTDDVLADATNEQ